MTPHRKQNMTQDITRAIVNAVHSATTAGVVDNDPEAGPEHLWRQWHQWQHVEVQVQPAVQSDSRRVQATCMAAELAKIMRYSTGHCML